MTASDYTEGKLLLVDKPMGWTSFQVVNKIRWLIRSTFNLKKIKVGHAGTLDPLATGLLIICTGKFTKKIEQYQALEKEYTGTFTLGATTPSYDLETEVDHTFDISHITDKMIEETAQSFLGETKQQPPIFSALKKDGKRLYEYAREGEKTEVPFRKILISEFEITRIDLPRVHFLVRCSKGTYIRSLAHDFGKALNAGAHLSSLRRTAIGGHHVNQSKTVEELTRKFDLLNPKTA